MTGREELVAFVERAMALLDLLGRTGDPRYAAAAVEVLRSARGIDSPDARLYSMYLNMFSFALIRLYELSGDEAVIEEAVHVSRSAVVIVDPDDPEHFGRMTNVCLTTRMRFEHSGERRWVEEAVAAGRTAVANLPRETGFRDAALSALAMALVTQYQNTGERSSLDEAETVAREAAERGSPHDHNYPGFLSNLATVLRLQYERSNRTDVLEEAVLLQRQAVAAAPVHHQFGPAVLSVLGDLLEELAHATGRAELRAESVRVRRTALAAAPPGAVGRAGLLHALGCALRLEFGDTGRPETIHEAVRLQREAVQATPASDHRRGVILLNLALTLLALHRHEPDAALVQQAAGHLTEAGTLRSARPHERIVAYRHLAMLPDPSRPPQQAVDALRAAIDLLPLAAPRPMRRADRQTALGRLAGLPGQCAAAALDAGQPELAVELLEQTRGILASSIFENRIGDVTRLAAHPGLAEEFVRLREEIAALDSRDDRGPAGPPSADDLQHAYESWDGLLARIRSQEGLADFLARPDARGIADCGPLVYLTSDLASRTDALILRADADPVVEVVPLPGVTGEVLMRRSADFIMACTTATRPGASLREAVEAQTGIAEVLAWLWDEVAEPVLDALGFTAEPEEPEDWPRVWWCPVGLFSLLPIHAAGRRRPSGPDGGPMSDPSGTSRPSGTSDPTGTSGAVLDRVISSTTTTGFALAQAHARPPADNSRLLIVSAPDALPDAPLPGVVREAGELLASVPQAVLLHDPDADTILTALPQTALVHFACHAVAVWDDPLSSRFLLRRGETDPMTVQRIMARSLRGVELAYLSACSTSGSLWQVALADEAIHITSAFQLAGYRTVIGTLWPVDDAVAQQVADGFYRALTRDRTGAPDPSLAAAALHHQLRRLRAEYPLSPTLWAPFLHTGI
ncbi:CHAT domain-containing protein [Catenulispora subtropica]|uniref:CHAT domain-containing protein n=1 Tax=Catenulispora subtropica TaxID=450798 RepID=A0ABN2T7Z8_9ACTN